MMVWRDYTGKALVTAMGAAVVTLGFVLWPNWVWRTALGVFVIVFVFVNVMNPEHRWWRIGVALIVAAKLPDGVKILSSGSFLQGEAEFQVLDISSTQLLIAGVLLVILDGVWFRLGANFAAGFARTPPKQMLELTRCDLDQSRFTLAGHLSFHRNVAASLRIYGICVLGFWPFSLVREAKLGDQSAFLVAVQGSEGTYDEPSADQPVNASQGTEISCRIRLEMPTPLLALRSGRGVSIGYAPHCDGCSVGRFRRWSACGQTGKPPTSRYMRYLNKARRRYEQTCDHQIVVGCQYGPDVPMQEPILDYSTTRID